jgi:hemin uptake protein HemP
MRADLQKQTLVVVAINPLLPPRVSSTQLLRGQRTVDIEHGNQHYTLRLTRDNKLILTK